jgi:hypothetical protein
MSILLKVVSSNKNIWPNVASVITSKAFSPLGGAIVANRGKERILVQDVIAAAHFEWGQNLPPQDLTVVFVIVDERSGDSFPFSS